MTDKELFEALQPLKDAIEEYIASDRNGGNVTSYQVQLMKNLYPVIITKVEGLSNQFNSGCGACIKTTFDAYTNLYYKLKEDE
jgi:hypothetical protein